MSAPGGARSAGLRLAVAGLALGLIGGLVGAFTATRLTSVPAPGAAAGGSCDSVQVAQSVLPAVVTVFATGADGQGGSGSGAVTTSDGVIVTNDHVIHVAGTKGTIEVLLTGGRTAEAMLTSARRLGTELQVRDEVDRRMRLREAQLANFGDSVADPERIREVHAELRKLAAGAGDPLGNQLRKLADMLSAGLSSTTPASTPLTSRELDVLSQVALGCTNIEAAQRLSLKPETVKSYLRSAAAKLGTRTRHEAVSRARRSRLIP